MAIDKEEKMDSFIRLLSRYQGQIYSYILSLVGKFNDSDDILQETSSKLWEIYDQYEPETDFLKWSLSVAYYRVLEYRKNAQRHKKVIYTDDFFHQLSDSAPKCLSRTREYLEKLKCCTEKLGPEDASIIKLRYNHTVSVKEIARRINRPIRGVYLSLARIHRLLLKCIEQA